MGPIAVLRDEFSHPIPGIVVFTGLGLCLLATAWAIVGGVVSLYASLSFALVGVIAVAVGALGTLTILVGAAWYGILLLVDLRADRLRIRESG
jgi:hypothetical protein